MMMGMSMGSDSSSMTESGGMFTPTDKLLAQGFQWFCLAIIIALALHRLLRQVFAISWYASNPETHDIVYSTDKSVNRRIRGRHNNRNPSRPSNRTEQVYATMATIVRELSYPVPFHYAGQWAIFSSGLSLGQWIMLSVYWTIILILLWSNVILDTTSSLWAYHWEIVAYRAAWVSVSQLPLVYCLSCKVNVISLITGISYERLNWLHRWTARTMFLTLIVHWAYFYREWSLGSIVALEFSMMPMVKYGTSTGQKEHTL